MGKNQINKKGFTLVEVIAVLLIASFLTALAGLGIVQLTKSYILAKESSLISADADFAVSRIRKSVRSLVDIGEASESKLEIERVSSENIKIKEGFFKENNKLNLYVNDVDYGPVATDFENFSFSYNSAAKGDGQWNISDPKADLASVSVEIEYSGPNGTKLVFADKIVPRNTFLPGMEYMPSGSGGVSNPSPCFIGQMKFDSDFFSEKQINLKNLYFFADFKKELKNYPLIFIIIFGFSLFTGKFMLNFLKKRRKFVFSNNKKGSLLLVVIAAIAVTSILGAAAVSFLSSGESQNVQRLFGQKAYYNSESGLRYALSEFIENKERDLVFAENIINDNKIYKTDSTQGFYLDFQSYYFRASSGGLKPLGNAPDEIKNHQMVSQGRFELQKSQGSREIVNVSNISFDSSNGVLNADGLPENIDEDENVFTVIRAQGSQTGIKTSQIGKDEVVGEISVKGGLTGFMPPLNGIVSFYGDTDTDGEYDDLVSLMYDRFDYGSKKLVGLRALPGKPLPSLGFAVADNTDIVCGRYAKIVSTGVAGINTSSEAKVSLTLNQPLDSAELVKMISNSVPGEESTDSLLGSHELAEEDSTSALKVTSTDTGYSYTQGPGNDPVYQQESLATYDWSNQDPDFLKNLWLKSNKKLSYEVQVKVKFTDTEDDLTSNPLNYPGNYMPGISFRVRKPLHPKNEKAEKGQTVYYGMSFMRGIAGRTEHREGGRLCGTDFETEDDDITDNFFYPEGDHGANIVNEPEYSCSDTDFVPSTWNDEPPLDGIPYLVFWQKQQSTDGDGDPVNTGCGSTGSFSPFEWLSYMPLVEAEKCIIYQYDEALNSDTKVKFFNDNKLKAELGPYKYNSFDYGTVNRIEIPRGYKVTLYASENLSGESIVFIKNTNKLQGWNNKISSVEIEFTGIPAGYYDGQIEGRAYKSRYTAWRLKDKYNILKKHEVDGQNILGLPGQIKVKDPANPDKLMEDNAYILPPVDTDSSYSDEEYRVMKSIFNYRLYIKPWATLGLRIMEFEGNLDCDPNGELERINAVTAFFGSEDESGGEFGNLKDGTRKAYSKNISNSRDYSVKWPSSGDYFTNAVWNGLGFNNSNEPLFPTDGGYTSKTVPSPDYGGCLSSFTNIKLVEKGYDLENDPVTVYSATFLTKGGNLGTNDYFKNYDVPEIGLHTLGINSNKEAPENQKETVYFKDFYWRFFEGGSSVALPGVITE
jgi:prepilin-type N-terminal cleavage/methylation domain-containing protein